MTSGDEGGGLAERQSRHQQAAAAADGARVGAILGGPAGSMIGAALGPLLVPFAEKVWSEVAADGRMRSAEALASACEGLDREPEELATLIDASDETRLLAGIAMSAASRTAWPAKVRTLGRSLAAGLLVADNAQIDLEQLILAAVADIEAPHLSLLELLVCREPKYTPTGVVAEPCRLASYPVDPADPPGTRTWFVGRRFWMPWEIATIRPWLLPVLTSLSGTLHRHGLMARNTAQFYDAIQKMFDKEDRTLAWRKGQQRADKQKPAAYRLLPAESWSPTELGEQVLDRFREAGAEVPDGWVSPTRGDVRF